MNRTNIINKFIENYEYNTYLEIGVSDGMNFNGININLKESIDPAEGRYSHAKPTYKMTSDDFFKKYPDNKYDIIFIDGLHHSEQVDKDIKNSLNSLNPNGTVILHDCNPTREIEQKVPRETTVWNGDVWKSFVKFNHSSCNNYKCYTIDTDYGCGVIDTSLKGDDSNITFPEHLTYDWLNSNRKAALNLISVEEFESMMEINE